MRGERVAEPESLLEFPCSFPIKAVGRAEPGFESLVIGIVRRHCPGLDAAAVSVRASSGGRWISVTLVVEAESRAQLDAIYLDLTAEERVVWAL
jgi:putative lipoic acid-binding regulatory protein